VGEDSFGRFVRRTMTAEGIDARYLLTDAQHGTGFMLKGWTVDGSDPPIEYHRRGSAASHMGLVDWYALHTDAAFPARHLHLTGITPALSQSTRELVFELARQARTAGASVSFDPNLRPRLWPSQAAMVDCINDLAVQAGGTVLPGLAEGRLLTGLQHPQDIADFYLRQGASQVLVKLGAQGAFFADAQGRSATLAAPVVTRVLDTVGAGDGFAVGVISAMLEGLDLAGACARGNAIGARIVQFPGDADGLPTRAELMNTNLKDLLHG
jgi:2-dehydro-3-deoxygluconokinase